MTPEQIREARALCERATEGPWEALDDEGEVCVLYGWDGESGYKLAEAYSRDPEVSAADNAAFIAAARTLLPLALDAIEERDAEIAALKRGIQTLTRKRAKWKARALRLNEAPMSEEEFRTALVEGIREVAADARERIHAYGNPLANLTPEQVEEARQSEAPEIIGAWPDPGEQVVS